MRNVLFAVAALAAATLTAPAFANHGGAHLPRAAQVVETHDHGHFGWRDVHHHHGGGFFLPQAPQIRESWGWWNGPAPTPLFGGVWGGPPVLCTQVVTYPEWVLTPWGWQKRLTQRRLPCY